MGDAGNDSGDQAHEDQRLLDRERDFWGERMTPAELDAIQGRAEKRYYEAVHHAPRSAAKEVLDLVAEVRARDTVIEAVRAVHAPFEYSGDGPESPDGVACSSCFYEDSPIYVEYPCATIRALEGATE